ncbi:MAG: hypothetical protein INR70_17280 [Parafilimonas terrae]|nr:hypothetical protein [Parafilimonas terrae]
MIADGAPWTRADGSRVPLKDLTRYGVGRHAAGILTVSEVEIVGAILTDPHVVAGQRVGVVVTGGNADLDTRPWPEKERT